MSGACGRRGGIGAEFSAEQAQGQGGKTRRTGGRQVKLFVGLGNPGAKYARNRHNIGFMALDRIATDHGFGPWRGRFQGQLSEGRLGAERVALLKPETFMNLSGQAVGEAARFFKLDPADIVVFHDELDLAPGRLRCKTGGGHAGHNGLRSIHAHIGESYDRVRLGIGHPGRKEAVAGYVLHDFAKADEGWLDDVLRGVADGAPALAAGEHARFLNAVSLRVAPARSGTGTKAAGGAQAAASGRPPVPEKPAPEAEPESAPASLLQRLVERFR
jgi:PTH1 family peptidyl-tRNA hydrolase